MAGAKKNNNKNNNNNNNNNNINNNNDNLYSPISADRMTTDQKCTKKTK